MARPEFHQLADRELNEAAQYYDLENPGLGSSFLKEIDRCLHSIEDQPEAGVILRGSVVVSEMISAALRKRVA